MSPKRETGGRDMQPAEPATTRWILAARVGHHNRNCVHGHTGQ
jgi:hypothetical protein